MARRVITGLNAEGRSAVLLDGPLRAFGGGNGGGHVWRAHGIPADNAGLDDAAPEGFSYDSFHDGGSNFFLVEMPPATRSSTHATDTLDYIVMMDGEVVLELEAEEVTLRRGDLVVDRGVIHTWRNDGPVAARYAVVTIPAHPVGAGRTV